MLLFGKQNVVLAQALMQPYYSRLWHMYYRVTGSFFVVTSLNASLIQMYMTNVLSYDRLYFRGHKLYCIPNTVVYDKCIIVWWASEVWCEYMDRLNAWIRSGVACCITELSVNFFLVRNCHLLCIGRKCTYIMRIMEVSQQFAYFKYPYKIFITAKSQH